MIKPVVKSLLRGFIDKVRTQIDSWDRERQWEHMERRNYEQDDLHYPWLNYQAELVLDKGGVALRPQYAWPVVQAAHLATALAIKRISVIEFGVGGGKGLLALERAAEITETMFEVKIDVCGFDSGQGLPKPVDYRDLPHFWKAASFPMDAERLKKTPTPKPSLVGTCSRHGSCVHPYEAGTGRICVL